MVAGRKLKILSYFLSVMAFGLAIFVVLIPAQVHRLSAADEPEPQLWAVVVGVKEYQCPLCIFDQEWNMYPVGLKHPDDNARDLAAELSPVSGEDHVKLVLNEQATNSGIYHAIKWLAEKAGSKDTALFYFCGHSAPQNFGSYDYLVSDRQMAEWLDAIHSQNVVIILDTCYAGSFQNALGKNGRAMLMSCQSSESSLEDRELEHTVFTYYILQALNNFDSADVNGDYQLSAEEIFDYANPRTSDEIVQPFANEMAYSNMQHPTLYIPPDKYGEINLITKAVLSSDAKSAFEGTALTVDGKSYMSKQLPVSLTWLSGTSHRFDVPLQIDLEDGTRLVFTSWNDGNNSASRTTSIGGQYTANYGTQYKLTVQSEYGNPRGSGWYNSGSSASVSVNTTCGNIIRHTFEGWTGDYTGQKASAAITMDKSKTIKANWHNDYLMLYLLIAAIISVVIGGITVAVMIVRRNTQRGSVD